MRNDKSARHLSIAIGAAVLNDGQTLRRRASISPVMGRRTPDWDGRPSFAGQLTHRNIEP